VSRSSLPLFAIALVVSCRSSLPATSQGSSPDAVAIDSAPDTGSPPDGAEIDAGADAATIGPDVSPLVADTAAPNPDTAPLTPDTAPLTPDTAPLTPDTAPLTPDTAPLTPDTATLSPDATPLVPDAAGAEAMPSFVDQACLRFCVTIALLQCPSEQPVPVCVADCKQTFLDYPGCRLPLEALLACIAVQPPENYECDADGTASLRDPFCQQEALPAVNCILSMP
jgi:hypothetical protein